MTHRLILLIVPMFFAGCSNDAPASKAPQQSPAATTATPSPEPAPPTMEMQETPVEEPTEALPENKTNRSDAKPNKENAKPKLPPSSAPEKKSNPAGYPTGYISRKNVVLQSEPSLGAPKTSTLKIYEAVIILETKMTDEAGKAFDVPQWYKVQLSNKQAGWVVSRSITVN